MFEYSKRNLEMGGIAKITNFELELPKHRVNIRLLRDELKGSMCCGLGTQSFMSDIHTLAVKGIRAVKVFVLEVTV